VHLPAGVEQAPGPPRVAFAIGRRVGKAVVRNRVRRRLRHVLAELERSSAPGLPGGSYLVVARPGADACTSDELRSHLVRALRRIDKKSQG
jgi:ribonuclease P protein component